MPLCVVFVRTIELALHMAVAVARAEAATSVINTNEDYEQLACTNAVQCKCGMPHQARNPGSTTAGTRGGPMPSACVRHIRVSPSYLVLSFEALCQQSSNGLCRYFMCETYALAERLAGTWHRPGDRHCVWAFYISVQVV